MIGTRSHCEWWRLGRARLRVLRLFPTLSFLLLSLNFRHLPTHSMATEASSADKPRNVSRDGEKIADMEYYDILSINGDATELDLKKAYRKAAIKNHPDKGGDEEKFKMIGEAYRVLSDNHLRADYDRHGKKCVFPFQERLILI